MYWNLESLSHIQKNREIAENRLQSRGRQPSQLKNKLDA